MRFAADDNRHLPARVSDHCCGDDDRARPVREPGLIAPHCGRRCCRQLRFFYLSGFQATMGTHRYQTDETGGHSLHRHLGRCKDRGAKGQEFTQPGTNGDWYSRHRKCRRKIGLVEGDRNTDGALRFGGSIPVVQAIPVAPRNDSVSIDGSPYNSVGRFA